MNKNDSWLIIGPGRTGSKVIVDILRSAYMQENIYLAYISPIRARAPARSGTILHSHNINDFSLGYEKCILSTRNYIESAISWCIQPHVGEWHLYSDLHKEKMSRITQFVLDPNLVLEKYNSIKTFYCDIDKYITPDTITIDYSEFCNNPSAILYRLGLDLNTPLDVIPSKNPGTYSDWILNWDEIQSVLDNLHTDPIDTPTTK